MQNNRKIFIEKMPSDETDDRTLNSSGTETNDDDDDDDDGRNSQSFPI